MAPVKNRTAVVELHMKGIRNFKICRLLNLTKQKVSRIVTRFHEVGDLNDRPRSGRPRTVDTPAVRKVIRERIRRNPRRSMRKMAVEIGVDEKSVRNIVKGRLGLRPYKFQKSHWLTDKMKAVRLERCRMLLHRHGDLDFSTILFSDEKVFTVEQKFNSQNDRLLVPNISAANSAGRFVSRSSHPAALMVWAGITSDGKTPLIFIPQGVKINKDNYIQQVLEAVVEPWACTHFGNKKWTFQQDSAPAHAAKMTQAWCQSHFPDFITSKEWPSNSPDLNPLDYSIWSILEAKISSSRYKNLDGLKAALLKAWKEIDVETLRVVVSGFRRRLTACVKAKGGHFENC